MRYLACTVALLTLASVSAFGQSATIHGDLLSDWTTMKDTMLKIADALPDDKFGYKPTPAQRTFGEQILHVAADNIALMKLLGSKVSPPPTDQKPKSKSEILKALVASYDARGRLPSKRPKTFRNRRGN